jgi:hypothetical protein
MKRAITVIIAAAVAAFLASPASANQPNDLPEAFMAALLQGKVGEAVDRFMETNPLLAEKKQQIQAAKAQIEGAFQVFGAPAGMEVVAVDDLAPSLRRFVFLTKHANAPLTWEFYVYKPKDTWIAANLNFNDNFSLTAPRR